MSTYKITNFKPDGSVDVVFSVDGGKTQNISKLPITDKDELDKALTEYGIAYEAGLAQIAAPATPPADVLAMKNVTKEIVKADSVDEVTIGK